ncbi:MAG: methyltransferase domain-containing protein [Lysobacteraceae bacterium]
MRSVIQPAGNFYDKYNTRNPVARRLMRGFLRGFDELVDLAGVAGSTFEVGCGEGELSMRLARAGWRVRGCDIAEEAVVEARLRTQAAGLSIPFECCDILDLSGRVEPCDLVVCCEVLEHLEDPSAAFAILESICRKHLLVSVPREPLWRVLNIARGHYWRDLGNTPGHIQHWSRAGFLGLLGRRFDVVAVRSPLPWTLALCRPRQ